MLIKNQYLSNFGENPSTMEYDLDLFKKGPEWRMYLSLLYRLGIKDIVFDHLKRLDELIQT